MSATEENQLTASPLLQKVHKRDDVVVYVDGLFDLFNVSHASLLAEAKKMGTFLVVGVYDDDVQKTAKWGLLAFIYP